MRAFLIISLFCLAANQAQSQGFNTTSEFAAMCSGDPTLFEDEFTAEMFQMNCERYLAGLVDGFVIAQRAGRPMVCPPSSGINPEQARVVFLSWALRNPQDAEGLARTSAAIALAEAFPCK